VSRIRAIAAVSCVYDGVVAVMMLAGRPLMARLFDIPLPVPPIHADLNGIFLLAVALAIRSRIAIRDRAPAAPTCG
jgi:ABC-type sulfate transport system permease subunit